MSFEYKCIFMVIFLLIYKKYNLFIIKTFRILERFPHFFDMVINQD